jgi:predicted DNA-binding transcriptional regulator YafY
VSGESFHSGEWDQTERRADRLFDIILTLRVATNPMTAATLAGKLEVTVRTVYRDIAASQASRCRSGVPRVSVTCRGVASTCRR